MTNWKDYFLKNEIMRAIDEAGFQSPSPVQQRCLPHALNGSDILCQAKAGTGKTAVFAIAALQRLDKPDPFQVLVLCHTRELAQQIKKEFMRLGKFLQNISYGCYYGGHPVQPQKEELLKKPPTVVVGCPGRIKDLILSGSLNVKNLKFFILDECDTSLEKLSMRQDIQDIYAQTNNNKQVMMFSGTMSEESKKTCRLFMQNQIEVFVAQADLVLYGLKQFKIKLAEKKKVSQLYKILDQIDYNQVIIFCKDVQRASALANKLEEQKYNPLLITGELAQQKRDENFKNFRDNSSRILVSTDVMGKGIDVNRVNLVINFDFPNNEKDYVHRIARAGRFDTEGKAISFIGNFEEDALLDQIQKKCQFKVEDLPEKLAENADQQ